LDTDAVTLLSDRVAVIVSWNELIGRNYVIQYETVLAPNPNNGNFAN
jgi:hypothetical protein